MTTPTLATRRKPAPPPLGPAPVWQRDKLFQEPVLPEHLARDSDSDVDDE